MTINIFSTLFMLSWQHCNIFAHAEQRRFCLYPGCDNIPTKFSFLSEEVFSGRVEWLGSAAIYSEKVPLKKGFTKPSNTYLIWLRMGIGGYAMIAGISGLRFTGWKKAKNAVVFKGSHGPWKGYLKARFFIEKNVPNPQEVLESGF